MEGRISAITRQKKDKKRASIFLNEEFAFGVNDLTIEEFRLRKGDYIDRELFDKITHFDYFVEAKRISLAYINYRARSEKEIRQRLAREEIPDQVSDRVIEFLKEYKFVDDEAWSKAYINDKLIRKAVSTKTLEFELQQHGIQKEIVEQALTELGTAASEESRALGIAEKQWERLMKSEGDSRKRKQKLFSFLASRGFSFEVIGRIYRQLSTGMEELESDAEELE